MRSAQPSSAVSCSRQIGDDLLSRIEHLILLDLLDDRPTIDRMDRRHGMSRRTLQRRLAEQGTSFEATLKGLLEGQAEMDARYTGFLRFRRLPVNSDKPTLRTSLELSWPGRGCLRGHGGLPAPLSRVTQQGCDRHRINPELSASSVASIVGCKTRRRVCAYGAIV